MVSHDLPCSTVTNQIAFSQRDSNTIFEFKRAIDRRCQALVFELETLIASLLPNCIENRASQLVHSEEPKSLLAGL